MHVDLGIRTGGELQEQRNHVEHLGRRSSTPQQKRSTFGIGDVVSLKVLSF